MFELTSFTRPERDLFRMMDAFDREMFGRGGRRSGSFSTDLCDCGDSYKLEAELPGFNKEDISVSVDGDLLTISAEHNETHEEEKKRKGYVYRERRYGSFTRSFDISGIDKENIAAEYKDGVLTLDLPKLQKPVETSRKIELR